jgi:hypothetical protein
LRRKTLTGTRIAQGEIDATRLNMTSPAPATPKLPLHSLADLTAENVRAVQRIEAEVHAQRSP